MLDSNLPDPGGRSRRRPETSPPSAAQPPPNLRRRAASRVKGDLAVVEDRIHERIHEAVLDQRLPPGTKLKEKSLAELFGVNRSVVRKVLARLAHAKVIELRPNRGAVVARPTIEESRDLFAARGAIEGAIVDAAVARASADEVRALRELVAAEQAAYARGEMRAGVKISIQFHRVLAGVAGNGVLADLLDQLLARTPLVILAHRSPARDVSCSNNDHSLIVDAIAARDADGAVAAVREHLAHLAGQLDLRDERPPVDLAGILGIDAA